MMIMPLPENLEELSPRIFAAVFSDRARYMDSDQKRLRDEYARRQQKSYSVFARRKK